MKNLLEILLCEIKSKSQIKSLENNYILDKLNSYFLTNGDIRKKLENEFLSKKEKIKKSKLFKEVIKNIRQEIGIVYGSFLTSDFSKKEKLLQNDVDAEFLLKLHKSTRERINFYNEIYSKIFNWYKPKKIADLACGLNPLSYELISNQINFQPKYFASDLNPKDMDYLNSFFKRNFINGLAKAYDITKLGILEDDNFIDSDLVFLFKALDSFEFVQKNISKELIEKIPSKKIVVSFPTKSLISKKEFKREKRNWFIRFLEDKNYLFEQFEVENEEFFLISK